MDEKARLQNEYHILFDAYSSMSNTSSIKGNADFKEGYEYALERLMYKIRRLKERMEYVQE
jgi:hypothetical protein